MSTPDAVSPLGPIVHWRVELGSAFVSLLEAVPRTRGRALPLVRTRPFPCGLHEPGPPGLERRSLQMFFLESDPRECWDELFFEQDAWLRAAGIGHVSYAAPFIPTIPGTDRYADELW